MLKFFRVVYLENAVTPELMHKIVNYSHVITNDVWIVVAAKFSYTEGPVKGYLP